MKRALKIIGVLVASLFIAVVAVVVATFMGRQAIFDGADANGLRLVKDGIVSVGVIPVSEKEVALVDAGNDKHGAANLTERCDPRA